MKHFASTFRSELTGAIRVAPRESIFNSEYLEGVAAFWAKGANWGLQFFFSNGAVAIMHFSPFSVLVYEIGPFGLKEKVNVSDFDEIFIFLNMSSIELRG